MDCPACGHVNPRDSRFCLNCGVAFALGCSRCGADLPADAKFCNRCGFGVQGSGFGTQPSARTAPRTPHPEPGSYTPQHLAEKILTSRAAIEGERKQVTVLFADVKSSMEIAEGLDPEEWHSTMDRFFSILSAGVHRFEGTVNQYTGDGIMALFGAPIAHEDHAQRACYAALYIQESLRAYADQLRLQSGLNFAVRIGLNSGEVVVGKIGDDLRMDYTAQGFVVGLAARMEQIAEPGKVYLTEHTAQLAGGYLNLRDLGETKVKGLSRALHVHELLGVGPLRTRFDVSRARGLSKFVGRAAEMEILEQALDSTIAGQGKAIGIVAQAGQGKSRLCYEFTQRCRARGIRVYQAQSVSHEKSVPLLPALQLMRGYFGITDSDDAATARDRVAGRVLLLDPTLADSLPVLFEFLGVYDSSRSGLAGDPATRTQRLAELLQRIGRARGEREAVVFLLEDLHWIDDASAAFVKRLLDDAPNSRTLVVVNFRPELKADWLSGSHYSQLALKPLERDDVAGLVADLLGKDESLRVLPDWLSQRTAGNPFYVEEVLRALIEEGALVGGRGAYRLTRPLASSAVPPTVQAILAARIDRLPEAQKDLLQAASVIGKDFSESILARVVAGLPQPPADSEIEEGLRGLVQAELIQEQVIYPEREYVFKHALTQEVSYGSQLTEKRRRLHAAAARALEDTLADKLDEKAAAVARHWENAGEMLSAAEWYCRAATWIGDRDLAGAAPLWTKVEEIARTIPDSIDARRLELSGCIGCLGSGFRFGISADEAERLHARGCDLARQLGDHEARARLDSLLVRVQWSSGSVPETEEPPAASVDPETRIMLMLDSVLGLQVTGKMKDALALATEAREMIEAQPELLNTTSGATILGFRSLIATLLGRLDVAAETIETAHRAAQENGFEEILGWTYGWRATLKMACGDIEASIADGRRALEIARKIGSTFSVATSTLGLANALWMKGDFEEVVRVCASSLESIRAQGAGIAFEAQILTFLGEGQLGVGDRDAARESIDRALELSRQRQNPVVASRAGIARAELLLHSESSEARQAVEAELDEVDRVIDECGVELWRPLAHRARAHLAMTLGDQSTATRCMRQAIEAYRRMGAPANAAALERELDGSVGSRSR